MATTTSTTATSGSASIVKTLGSGSGIDLAALVDGLVQAQFSAKNAQLSKQADTLTTKISGVATLKSNITSFDAALKSLVKGGTLQTQPTSSSAAIGVATVAGGSAAGLNARVQVTQLASAQAATTNAAIGRTAAFRPGTLTVTIAGTATPLTIAAADATLDGVAAKINAAGLGLTASIVTDGAGARLTVKGQSGAAGAFTIAGADADPNASGMSLADLSVGAGATGTTIGTPARDALLTVDGATFTRATNSVADLLPGVRLELKDVGVATLGTTAPTAQITQAVNDYVETFNQVRGVLAQQLDPVTGALRGDPAATQLSRALGQLTTTPLAANTGGAPRTLADLGVRTNRDGTLAVDSAKLTRALAAFPAAAEAMFADGAGSTNGGLSAALSAIAARATDRVSGFDAETQRYTAQRTTLTDAQSKATTDAAAMKDRLTQQFASMDSKVAAYKSTGDFLKQQVDAWYKSN